MKTLTTYADPANPATTKWLYDNQRGWLIEKNYPGETGNKSQKCQANLKSVRHYVGRGEYLLYVFFV